MKNLTRAGRKKARKSFAVGDVVTWGAGRIAHRVVEVTDRGVVIDVTSCVVRDPSASRWARSRGDGTYVLLVLFDGNTPSNSVVCARREHGVVRGPVRHSELVPDRAPVPWDVR